MESGEISTIRLDLALPILKRRWLPASVVFAIIFSLFYFASLKDRPVYIAEGTLLIEKTTGNPFLSALGEKIGELNPLAKESSPLDTEAEVITSVPAIQEVIKTLKLTDEFGKPLQQSKLLKNLSISQVNAGDILKISYQDPNGKKAASIVNTVMDIYIENDVLHKRYEISALRDFIEEKLPEAEANLDQAETALRQFKEQNNFFALQDQATSTVNTITELQQKITETESQMANVNTRYQVLQQQLGMTSQQAKTSADLSQAPAVKEALTQLQDAESQLAVEKTRLTDNHPTIIELESKVATLKGMLQGRVGEVSGDRASQSTGNLQMGQLEQDLTKELVSLENNRFGLESQVDSLKNLQNNYQQQLNILPQLEQEQRKLERELEIAQATYSQLSQKLEEVRLNETQIRGNASLLSPALIPEKPISRKSLYKTMGVFLGGLLAVATALLLEMQDRSIKSVDEAKAQLQFALLGVIPTVGKSSKILTRRKSTPQIVVRDNPRSPISEAYRMLQTKLKFACAERDVKVIVVTSAIAKEGKSTVAANLAAAISQVGRRVLLVDADLRRPLQHEIWNLSNEMGLGNTIGGQIDLEVAIQPTMPHLDILTAGALSPNPIALLDSQRMTSLMEEFADRYDFVIIDAPPLNVAADASILGKMADGILWVVRPGVLDSTNMAVAQEIVDQSRQTVLGVVVNGVIGENEYNSYNPSEKAVYS